MITAKGYLSTGVGLRKLNERGQQESRLFRRTRWSVFDVMLGLWKEQLVVGWGPRGRAGLIEGQHARRGRTVVCCVLLLL